MNCIHYYDQAGNLVQTVPPAGVHPLATDGGGHFTASVLEPGHRMGSRYKYNSLNQVTYQETPDGGETVFWYNSATQLRFSRNTKQGDEGDRYSFVSYDGIGRITVSGELWDTDFATGLGANLDNGSYPGTGLMREVSVTAYDLGDNGRNRVGAVSFADYNYSSGEFLDRLASTQYQYDLAGNVKGLTQLNAATGYKTMGYRYDLISGKVNEVRYQPGAGDQFIHRYVYDADNRITKVRTSRDGWLWEEDARYFYYPHGPLSRVEIGQDNLQGLDYYYTIHGWLRGINGRTGEVDENVLYTSSTDPGLDGHSNVGNLHRWTGRDEFALALGYYQGDYLNVSANPDLSNPFNAPWATASMGAWLLPPGNGPKGLYNGNIAWMGTYVPELQRQGMGAALEAYAFKYDQLHRIKEAKRYVWNGARLAVPGTADRYKATYAYDPNGNLTSLHRYDGSGNHIDALDYKYELDGGKLVNNRLLYIDDPAASSGTVGDITDQSNGNYEYDGIGNLTKDFGEGILEIMWNPQGKVKEVKKALDLLNGSANLEFRYDGMGQRTMKIVKPHVGIDGLTGNILTKPEAEWIYTVYVRDASGNVMAVYNREYNDTEEETVLTLEEQPIYGSSRVGMYKFASGLENMRKLGYKRYELSNHLGNVNGVISDIRIGIDGYEWDTDEYVVGTDGIVDYYKPEVVNAYDYYAFGGNVPN